MDSVRLGDRSYSIREEPDRLVLLGPNDADPDGPATTCLDDHLLATPSALRDLFLLVADVGVLSCKNVSGPAPGFALKLARVHEGYVDMGEVYHQDRRPVAPHFTELHCPSLRAVRTVSAHTCKVFRSLIAEVASLSCVNSSLVQEWQRLADGADFLSAIGKIQTFLRKNLSPLEFRTFMWKIDQVVDACRYEWLPNESRFYYNSPGHIVHRRAVPPDYVPNDAKGARLFRRSYFGNLDPISFSISQTRF